MLSAGSPRVFALVFDTGDEVIDGLGRFARESGADAAGFTAIGAFSDVTLGYFDLERQDYRRNPLTEQVEVVSLVGDITRSEASSGDQAGSSDQAGSDEPGSGDARQRTVHAHVVVARADGTAMGGHLLEAHVRPTLEVVVTESPAHLRRRHDPATGLALIDLGASCS